MSSEFEWFLGIVIGCIPLWVPVTIYLSVKLATVGYLRVKQRFINQENCKNG